MKQTIVLIAVTIFLTGCVKLDPRLRQYEIAGERVSVEIADSEAKRTMGLSGRATPSNQEGMLFLFKNGKDEETFWMKGMKFSIDLLWIADNRVIGVEQNMPTDEGRKLYQSPAPVDQVLELPAGWVAAHGVKVGSEGRLVE